MKKYDVIYDGDCGICSRSVKFLLGKTKSINAISFFEYDTQFPNEIPMELAIRTVILKRNDDGHLFIESEAIIVILKEMKNPYKILGKILHNRFFVILFLPIYRFIARNRAKISSLLGLNACKI